jgi:two-component system, NtrC family, nitrogen regulation sensor histidine kinase NtrY
MKKNSVQKLVLPILFAITTCCLLYFVLNSFSSNKNYQKLFQKAFDTQEAELVKYHNNTIEQIKRFNSASFSKEYAGKSEFLTHVYKNDSLLFWNTNKVPISHYAELQFPSDGLIRFQNGWYFSKVTRVNEYTLATTFPIQRTFPIHNEQLIDYFFQPFPASKAQLSLNNTPFPIQTARGSNFYLDIKEQLSYANFTGIIFFLSIIVFFLVLFFCRKLKWNWIIFTALVVYLIFTICIVNSDYSFEDSSLLLFDPSVVSINEYFPHLMLIILWVLFFAQLAVIIARFFRNQKRTFLASLLGVLVVSLYTILVANLIPSIAKNSKVNIDLDNILAFTSYSAISIGIFGTLCWTYLRLLESFWYYIFDKNTCKTFVFYWFTGLIGCVVILQLFFGELNSSSVYGILFLICLATYLSYRVKIGWDFVHWFLLLVVTATYLYLTVETVNIRKERDEREIYASQLLEDQDIATEIEFEKLKSRIRSESYFKRFISGSSIPNGIQLKSILDKRIYVGFWERYDITTYVYDTNTVYASIGKLDLDSLIEFSGKRSEIDSSIFYIPLGNKNASYIFRLHIPVNNRELAIYGVLESKKIPKKISFPRLLISENSASLPWTETYSGAKYFKQDLNYAFGEIDFYPKLSPFFSSIKNKVWKYDSQFSYLILKDSDKHTIVLAKRKSTIWNYITGISFITLIFGVLMVISFWISGYFFKQRSFVVNISSRIRLAVVGLVAVSLLVSILTNGTFFTSGYTENTKSLVNEKLESIRLELLSKYGERDGFSVQSDPEILEQRLTKWSKLFFTDINVFLLNGELLASSEHKLYNLGLLSEQMNPEAFHELAFNHKPKFTHFENIGTQKYISSYAPLFNESNKLIAYLNLQYFDQQDRLENQLRTFIVTLVNVFVILLLISVMVSFLVSSWIIKPLQYLQNSFSVIEFGKSNKRLSYTENDEIGQLVKAYNEKLNELEVAAAKLVQTEKEGAWREMAKQVAHEIKNPLTPMKLSLQHLQRSFDPLHVNAKERLDKVIID